MLLFTKKDVIARLVRATHFTAAKLDRPDKPGNEDFI
jgi:hypothetical protein